MSSTLLEVTRAGHEELERLERLIVKELQNDPANNKDRLFQSHRVRNMIDTITATTEKLVSPLQLSKNFPSTLSLAAEIFEEKIYIYF